MLCEHGGGGGGDSEKSQNIGFLSNTGPDPLKGHKATRQSQMLPAIIGTPAKRHLNCDSLAGR